MIVTALRSENEILHLFPEKEVVYLRDLLTSHRNQTRMLISRGRNTFMIAIGTGLNKGNKIPC